jgi:hypothetical protein
MQKTQRNAAATLASIALAGSAALVAFDGVQLLSRAPIAGLAVLLTHLFLGWILPVAALLAVSVRRSTLTVVALSIAGVALVAPLVIAVLV